MPRGTSLLPIRPLPPASVDSGRSSARIVAHGKGTALVVGAGVTGLAAAVALAQRGWSVEVWEARSRAGGLLAPFRFRGVDCDLGSHRLHPVALQHPFVRDLLAGLDLPARARRGRLVLGGRRLGYPPSLPGLLGGLGLRRSLSLGISFLTRRADLQRHRTLLQPKNMRPLARRRRVRRWQRSLLVRRHLRGVF